MRMSELHAERSTEQMLEDEVCSLQRQLRETATLRDQFAMAALPSIQVGNAQERAEFAFMVADAMLKARKMELE